MAHGVQYANVVGLMVEEYDPMAEIYSRSSKLEGLFGEANSKCHPFDIELFWPPVGTEL